MWILLLIPHLILLYATRFTLWPEMLVYPYLFNNNFLLYRDLINPYPPALIVALSFFAKIFGYSPPIYQILTWLIILSIDILIYLIVARIFKSTKKAFLSTLFFVIISVPFGINGLWFDLVQTPFILLSTFFLYLFFKTSSKKDLFFSATFLTIAFFIKQQVIWFAPLLLFTIINKNKGGTVNLIKKNYFVAFPFITLFVVHLLFFLTNGTIQDFLYWVLYFPLSSTNLPGYISLPTISQLLAVLSAALLFIPALVDKSSENYIFLFAGFTLFLFAYPRFDYFHLVPALAVLSVIVYPNKDILKKIANAVKIIPLLSLIFLLIFTFRYLKHNSAKEIRFFDQEIQEAAYFLEIKTSPDYVVYIQNGPDQILPLASRLPAKPWVDEFPWYLERGSLQDTVVESLQKDPPKLIIYKPYTQGEKFGLGSYVPEKINRYIKQNYRTLDPVTDAYYVKIKK